MALGGANGTKRAALRSQTYCRYTPSGVPTVQDIEVKMLL